MNAAPLVALSGISKTFGGVHAVENVSLDLNPGEVLGLLGHNGAGKSTLIKILSGVYPPDGGEIRLSGAPVSIRSTRDAKALADRWVGLTGKPGRGEALSDGLLLAFAYPERIARARGPLGEFQLTSGRGAFVDPTDALARETWLAVAELGGALMDLAETGIVHRDLKPSNVLLSVHGVHLIDFGISKALDASSITSTGARVGTPAYMSPEYLRTGECDAASDLFSLAGTLAYAVAGRAPFGDGTGVDVMHRVAFEPPNPEVMAEVEAADRELCALLFRCLSKDPRQRPGEMVDVRSRKRPFGPSEDEPPEDYRRQRYHRPKNGAVPGGAVLRTLDGPPGGEQHRQHRGRQRAGAPNRKTGHRIDQQQKGREQQERQGTLLLHTEPSPLPISLDGPVERAIGGAGAVIGALVVLGAKAGPGRRPEGSFHIMHADRDAQHRG